MSVTVAITRKVDPSREAEMVAWLRAGTELAHRFDGFLGQGWVRGETDSDEWHMLYRFSDEQSLAVWEESEQRRWWLDSGKDFVHEARVIKKTGIEGWFDEPSNVNQPPAASAAPPRWKQMVAIFIVFYPLSVAANFTTSHFLSDWVLPARALVSVILMTPVMTYLALPWITRLLAPWLNKTKSSK